MQGLIYLLILLANATSMSIFQLMKVKVLTHLKPLLKVQVHGILNMFMFFSILSITNFRLGKFRKFIMTILALS